MAEDKLEKEVKSIIKKRGAAFCRICNCEFATLRLLFEHLVKTKGRDYALGIMVRWHGSMRNQ